MCSSVDYGLYQGIVKLLQDSTSSYCVSPYGMQYIVHTAAVVSYTHIYCTSLCGQVSVATHHWRHNSDCSIIYMHSYSGTTLTQLLHFSLRTFFFLLLYMTGDTKGTAVLYSYCSIKHTVTSPQWTVCYCYTSLKMQRFWLVLLHLHTMLELLHLHTIYTPRLHIKAHISDVNSSVSFQFTSQSFVAINPSPHPQR